MDIKDQYEALTAKLNGIVPFTAYPTRELVQVLRSKGQTITLKTELTIKDAFNSGDISGIVCVTTTQEEEEVLACALTHITVPRGNPLFKEIVDYQQKRAKRLLRMNQWG